MCVCVWRRWRGEHICPGVCFLSSATSSISGQDVFTAVRINVCIIQMHGKLFTTSRTNLYSSSPCLFLQLSHFHLPPSCCLSHPPFFSPFPSQTFCVPSLFSSLFLLHRARPVLVWTYCPLVVVKLCFSSASDSVQSYSSDK